MLSLKRNPIGESLIARVEKHMTYWSSIQLRLYGFHDISYLYNPVFFTFLYPRTTKLLGGGGILVSLRPSVRPSAVCPSVRPSVPHPAP